MTTTTALTIGQTIRFQCIIRNKAQKIRTGVVASLPDSADEYGLFAVRVKGVAAPLTVQVKEIL